MTPDDCWRWNKSATRIHVTDQWGHSLCGRRGHTLDATMARLQRDGRTMSLPELLELPACDRCLEAELEFWPRPRPIVDVWSPLLCAEKER